MAIYPDTSEFGHPNFTQPLPIMKNRLASALAEIDQALAVAHGTSNANVRVFESRLMEARGIVLSIFNSLQHRY